MRKISPEEKQRILFGLDLSEEPTRRRGGGGAERPAESGGDLTCPICGKTGLTKRGLSLHMARIHEEERGAGEGEAA